MDNENRRILLDLKEDVGRLKETAQNTYLLVAKLEEHNAVQNGHILNLIKTANKNTFWRKAIAGVGIPIIVLMFGWLIWIVSIL